MLELKPFLLNGYPTDFSWKPGDTVSGVDTSFELQGAAGSDIFFEPGTSNTICRVEGLGEWRAEPAFQFSAHVDVDFRAQFDSAVLLGWADQDHWFKICAEQDPHGQARVVTVVTRGRSDDSNGRPMPGTDVWLRIGRDGATFSLHSSFDGSHWDLVRLFELGIPPEKRILIGSVVQSPAGNGTSARFDAVRLTPEPLRDPRGVE
jgi:regulation of enolase protein 1 (concanavalin A-like superfamily)